MRLHGSLSREVINSSMENEEVYKCDDAEKICLWKFAAQGKSNRNRNRITMPTLAWGMSDLCCLEHHASFHLRYQPRDPPSTPTATPPGIVQAETEISAPKPMATLYCVIQVIETRGGAKCCSICVVPRLILSKSSVPCRGPHNLTIATVRTSAILV